LFTAVCLHYFLGIRFQYSSGLFAFKMLKSCCFSSYFVTEFHLRSFYESYFMKNAFYGYKNSPVFINMGVIVKVYKEDRAIVGVLCTLGPTAY